MPRAARFIHETQARLIMLLSICKKKQWIENLFFKENKNEWSPEFFRQDLKNR